MKIAIGLLVAFLIGAGCRYFELPAPCPPLLPGALLVVAMTLGFVLTDRALGTKLDPAPAIPSAPATPSAPAPAGPVASSPSGQTTRGN